MTWHGGQVLAVRRPLLFIALPAALLSGCIPYHDQEPASASSQKAEAAPPVVAMVEAEPVWTAQQVIPNAARVPASTYVVQPGDTLRGVGNRMGAGAEMMAKANGLTPPFAIRAGQRLSVPEGRYHAVQEGETGIAIASAYGVRWSQMVDVNGLTAPFALRRGQRLLLPDNSPHQPPSLEKRAAAFRIDIDDVLTGGQPATVDHAPLVAARALARPLPANVPAATPATFRGHFGWPVRGTIVSRFGPGASGARNNGVDIGVPVGTPIKASADGVVAYAGDKVAVFGGLMLITHGGGWASAYGHARRVDVVRGQKVRKGQVIGLSGDSGYASQPKVHFELRKDRVPMNPLQQLPPAP